MTDAREYLNLVKHFGDSSEIFNKFLDILKDFQSRASDTHRVIERVSQLLAGNQRLILGFNTFLLAGHEIEAQELAEDERAGARSFSSSDPGLRRNGGHLREAQNGTREQ